MEVVNVNNKKYEQVDHASPGSSIHSDTSSTTSENDQFSDDIDKISDEDDLKQDLQRTVLEYYKSDLNIASQNTSTTNDEEFQATALCQFMDILNDLDEVLDKSLLACLDDTVKSLDSDDDDLICKIKECIGNPDEQLEQSEATSLDNDNVICAQATARIHENHLSQALTTSNRSSLRRSKSFSELSDSQRQAFITSLEQSNTTYENLRNSMRRLDPIVLPAITVQEPLEPLTLPVILFLEHHVNMRPTSAPLQLQVTAANLSSDGASGPLIVGRRTLLMNRALSLPSPGESDITAEWGRNTARSTARSTSLSSSSSESIPPMTVNQTVNSATDERDDETEDPPFGIWPHRMSSMLACLSCTVGIFNISRFAILSVHFGACFIVQFCILSFLIGIPLFTLQFCLGQVLEAGPVDMWRISPIFLGVGISLLITQAIIGIYSIMGLSWIFVYFRDSFITSDDKYKWALPFDVFNVEDESRNSTFKIEDTLPQYFHGEVLQRNLGSNNSNYGTIKFQVAFNLAVVWMIVFVALSKGLKSYGKAVYMLIFLPIIGTLILCTKLLTLIPFDTVNNIFSDTQWSEFFINSNSWAAASQETFLTWGLFGACIMQLASHKNVKSKTNTMLQKECGFIIVFTFAMLLLGAFLANTCVEILKNHGYLYIPGSFETVKSFQFLWPMSEPMPGSSSTPIRYTAHYASLVGIKVIKQGPVNRVISGWQPLQLATQLLPAALAVVPTNLLSPVWAVMFYFILIMFGIGQQLAIWHCVITGIMAIDSKTLKVWETCITFLSCVFGLAMGLLLCTDSGIKLVHFLDYVVVGSWWICCVVVAQCVGVFVVRGRPYSGDVLARALLRARARPAAALGFTWTLVLPVVLCALSVMDFRIGLQKQLYTWKKPVGYWPIWARQIAVGIQQGGILLIPITAFVQTWRYMNKGPPDILDRIQNLYRPRLWDGTPPAAPVPPVVVRPDPPPKYTPPPSYSTATGARLLNTIRRSFRTLRRITSQRTEPLTTLANEEASQLPPSLSETVDRERVESQPPEYSGVFSTPSIVVTDETDSRDQRPPSRPRPRSSTSRNSLSLTRDFLRRSFVRKSDSAKSIRSSLRRSFKYGGGLTTSHEHLVRDAEPISNTVAMSAMLDNEGSLHSRSLASVI